MRGPQDTELWHFIDIDFPPSLTENAHASTPTNGQEPSGCQTYTPIAIKLSAVRTA